MDQCPRQGRRLWLHERIYEERRYVFCVLPGSESLATNEIYDGIPAYLEKFDADEREMTGYIIGTISDMDTPMNPSAKGARSMTAYLQELDYETLSKERSQIIGAQPADIRALKPLIASVLSDGSLCVIGNEDVLTSEKQMFETLESLT